MTYETAGSLANGKRIWLLGRMPETTVLGDKVDPYICFANTHDGTGAIKVMLTPIRIVCQNTLNLALSTAKRSWSTKHMGDMQSKLEEARSTILFADNYMNELKNKAEALAKEKISPVEIENFLNELFPVDLINDSSRKVNNVQEIKDNFYRCYRMPDNANFVGTKYGVVNAMTDLADHIVPARMTKTFKENNWGRIMNGHPMVDKALNILSA